MQKQQSVRNSSSVIELSEFEVVYCDSLVALEQCIKDGLKSTAEVRTSSPDLFFSGLPGVRRLFPRCLTKDLQHYMKSGSNATELIYKNLIASHEYKPYALLASRVVHRVHYQLTKITTLSNEDFNDPRLIVSIDSGDIQQNSILNPPWIRFLEPNPNAIEKVVQIRKVQKERSRAPIFNRLSSYASTQNDDVRWIVGKLYSYAFSRKRGGKKAMVVIGSHLVRNVVGHLVFNNFSIDHFIKSFKELDALLQLPEGNYSPNSFESTLIQHVASDFRSELEQWFTPDVLPGVVQLVKDELARDLWIYNFSFNWWHGVLIKRNPAIVLMRTPARPELLALSSKCKQLGIPTVAAQHGVSREIEDSFRHRHVVANENAVVDLTLVYNQRSLHISNKSPFCVGESVVTGLSADYYRRRSTAYKVPVAPVVYVSTGLLMGNFNMLKGSWTDIDRIRFEINLIDDVLSKVKSDVVYKAYPHGMSRYAEENTVEKRIAQSPNIKLFDAPIELVDFPLHRFELIITARATSTLAWCLMANRPLALINLPGESSLHKEIKNIFSEALFLFDGDTSTSTSRLHEFLSKPREEIEDEWLSKTPARKILMKEYIEGESRNAGKRGALAVSKLQSNLKPPSAPLDYS